MLEMNRRQRRLPNQIIIHIMRFNRIISISWDVKLSCLQQLKWYLHIAQLCTRAHDAFDYYVYYVNCAMCFFFHFGEWRDRCRVCAFNAFISWLKQHNHPNEKCVNHTIQNKCGPCFLMGANLSFQPYKFSLKSLKIRTQQEWRRNKMKI